MKKIHIVIIAALLSLLIAVPAFAAVDVTVKVDGNTVSFPDQKPYIDENDRTMVPVRAPMEAMGCAVEWNDQARQAAITRDGITAVFTIGSNTYTVNGKTKTMDTQAVISGERTAFPVRFAAEAMGAKVYWNQDERTVYIVTADTPGKTSLTDADIKNLQGYGFVNDAREPKPGDEMGVMPYVDSISADFVDNKLLKDGLNHIINRCFEPGQKFLTHRDLTYFTASGAFGIRGVLITPNPDGSFTEQDYECFISWNGEKFANPYTGKLGNPRIVR